MAHPIHSHTHGTATTKLPADAVRAAKEASAGTGTDFRALLASSLQESNRNAAARNPRSSAMGAYQFTSRTWLDLVHRHGAEVGRADLAAQVTVKHGAPTVADPAAREKILGLRSDTQLAGEMAARYFAENHASLEKSLGRAPSANEVQMAYLLGASGASRLIKAASSEPQVSAAKIVPSAVKHNPTLFTAHGHVRSAGDAVAALNRHFDAGMNRVDHATGTRVSLLSSDDDAA